MSQSPYLNQKPDDPSKPYVFISYARGDAPEDTLAAVQIEEALVAAEIHCFRDVHMPRGEHGGWEISHELDECNLMVLVVSPRSMDKSRRQVTDEWYSFVQKQKKILPFKIDETKLPHNLGGLNYIDAINDREQGLKDLLEAIRPGAGGTFEKRSNPALNAYRQSRIELWSQPRYQIDHRFVTLSLTLDSGKKSQNRYGEVEQFNASDLREVLDKTRAEHPVLVLLGKPGSGKSTLLRRLELDHCREHLEKPDGEISFLVSLNGFKSVDPMTWLSSQWREQNPGLGSLQRYLEEGRVLLLLDALNEMPLTQQASYEDLVGQWRDFARSWTIDSKRSNRIIFSCRSLDYSVLLSSEHLPVPHLTVQPMDRDQVRTFIDTYAPGYLELIALHLEDRHQLELYGSPYFLTILCEVVENDQSVPQGRAGLFTRFVRLTLKREMEKENRLLSSGNLLHKFDRSSLNNNGEWKTPFDLPGIGPLIKQLSQLAYKMQSEEPGRAANEIQISYEEALGQIEYEKPEDILDAGISLNILDLKNGTEITFFHQLLQEYFAARRLASAPKPELAHQEWRREQVDPRYEEVIKGKKYWEPVPPLRQTGWEETVATAAPMAADPAGFIRSLIPQNLPLAARCADSAELVKVTEPQREALRRELRDQLLRRMRDPEADLRARLAAGEALGTIGHPEFERHSGKFGDFLLPPFEPVPAGTYPFGEKNQQVKLDGFRMGRYPVTNAEFACFIDAGGYRDAQWWDTDAARAWLKRSNPEAPEYWNNTRYNNPAQPVVGVSWYEARAFCSWLTASLASWSGGDSADRIVRLPTEPEFEAAARGPEGRQYPYGNTYDQQLSNSLESGIGRPSPVGLFENASQSGIYDLSGSIWEWCLNEYNNPLDEPTIMQLCAITWRTLRGGSWRNALDQARAVCRSIGISLNRGDGFGFRVVSVVRPIPLFHFNG